MKIKYIQELFPSDLEDSVNDFCNKHNVIDIKLVYFRDGLFGALIVFSK